MLGLIFIKLSYLKMREKHSISTPALKKSSFGVSGWLSWFERSTLDFSSDHNLRVMGWSPTLGFVLSVEST